MVWFAFQVQLVRIYTIIHIVIIIFLITVNVYWFDQSNDGFGQISWFGKFDKFGKLVKLGKLGHYNGLLGVMGLVKFVGLASLVSLSNLLNFVSMIVCSE